MPDKCDNCRLRGRALPLAIFAPRIFLMVKKTTKFIWERFVRLGGVVTYCQITCKLDIIGTLWGKLTEVSWKFGKAKSDYKYRKSGKTTPAAVNCIRSWLPKWHLHWLLVVTPIFRRGFNGRESLNRYHSLVLRCAIMPIIDPTPVSAFGVLSSKGHISSSL